MLFKKHERVLAYILGSHPTEAEAEFLKSYGPAKGGRLRHRNASDWRGEVERVAPDGSPASPLIGPRFAVPETPRGEPEPMIPSEVVVHRNASGQSVAEHYRQPYGERCKVTFFEASGETVTGDEPPKALRGEPRTVRALKRWLDDRDIPYPSNATKPQLLKLYAAALDE